MSTSEPSTADIEARLKALEILVLSSIVTSNSPLEDQAEETIALAKTQCNAMIEEGNGRALSYLNTLLDQIRFVLDLPSES